MADTRREALRKALAAAIAAATPTSLLLAAGRVATLKVRLRDGSELEFTERQIFHVRPPSQAKTPVVNGDFQIQAGGHIVVERGVIKTFTPGGPASKDDGGSFSQTIFMREGPVFVQSAAEKVNRAAPVSAKTWVIKNQAGDELQFKGQ